MWQQFSENTRRVVFFAQEQAQQFGLMVVTPDHLLLGMTREPNNVASVILQRLGLPPEVLRKQLLHEEILRQMARGSNPQPPQDMQLSEDSKRAVDQASEEARELGNTYIGTEHLLAGILRQGNGPAVQVLAALGIDAPAVRQQILAYEEPEQEDAPSDRSQKEG